MEEAMDPERVAQLQKQFASKPKPAELQPGVEQAVIQKFKSLPQDRKNIIKQAMMNPCANCQDEFKGILGGRQIGKSHGICKRHAMGIYKQVNKPFPENFGGKCVDISILSDDEKKLLGYLFSVVRRRQKAKGVYEGLRGWKLLGLLEN
jgi:hypothetical protein